MAWHAARVGLWMFRWANKRAPMQVVWNIDGKPCVLMHWHGKARSIGF